MSDQLKPKAVGYLAFDASTDELRDWRYTPLDRQCTYAPLYSHEEMDMAIRELPGVDALIAEARTRQRYCLRLVLVPVDEPEDT